MERQTLEEKTFGDKTLLEAIESLDKDRHFDAAGAMKEAVYGWYPPANNPWYTYRKQTPTYKKECLFRHYNSKFAHDSRGLGVTRSPSCEITGIGQNLTPKPPKSGHGVRSHPGSRINSRPSSQQDFRTSAKPDFRRPVSSQQDYRSGSANDFRPARPGSRQDSRCSSARSRTGWGMTPASAQDMHISGTSNPYPGEGFQPNTTLSDFLKTAPKPPTAHKTKPSKVWAYKVPQTTAHLLKNNNNSSKNVPWKTEGPGTKTMYWENNRLLPCTPTESVRAQSASLVRKTTPDTRQVKSAGRNRPELSEPPQPDEKDAVEKSASESRSDEDLVEPSDEAIAGSSETESIGEQEEGAEETKENPEEEATTREAFRAPTPPPLDYEEQEEKYGWKFQIPGDPLGLKTPCLPKRQSITVKCRTPETRPDPPKTHAENYDTFFYNTIPRHPLSFDIHQEFVSEILHAKRMELQKREGGVGYRYKNFSFVY